MLPLGIGVLMVAIALGVPLFNPDYTQITAIVLLLIGAVLTFSFSRRPLRFFLGSSTLVAFFLVMIVGRFSTPTIYVERSFFGVNAVISDDASRTHTLIHGDTNHGMQSTDSSRRCEALTYFHRTGPIGQLLTTFARTADRKSIGVIGLGTGSLVVYRRPGQEWTFYEIDPAVERIARDPRLFTFLGDCEEAKVVLGDARLSLQDAPNRYYDLLVLDAYSSDSIPVHIITREALDLYLDTLAQDGTLAFHITNRYIDLEPVLAVLAADRGLAGLIQQDVVPPGDLQRLGKASSTWVVISRSLDDIGLPEGGARWKPLQLTAGFPVWTDDYSSIVTAIRWGS